MKKIISLLLVFALCVGAVCVLAACNDNTVEVNITNPPEMPSENPEIQIAGGWQINTETAGCDMPEGARGAFERAMSELDGAIYTPIAYLGSQVVAGTNYAFLCRTELVTEEPVISLSLVTVYNSLDGNASIREIVDVRIADYTENEDLDFNSALVGAWTPVADYPAKLSEEDQAAFDAAMEGLAGVDYTPLALMGTQLVAGRNLAFLCCAQSVTPDSAAVLAVVVVYAALDGTAEVTSISPISIG